MWALYGGLIGGAIGLFVWFLTTLGNKGGRLTQVVPFNGDKDRLAYQINEYIISQGYSPQVYNNENVYCRGDGYITLGRFIKFSLIPEGFLIEAFITNGKKEQGLKGFAGALPKSKLKKTVAYIVSMINGAHQPPDANGQLHSN